MDVPAYLYAMNKNSGFPMDPDEMKDLEQEITIYFSTRNLNDLLQKKVVLRYYSRAAKKKIRLKEIAKDAAYLHTIDQDTPSDAVELSELEQQRLQALDKLKLSSPIQKKIMELLISGMEYPQVRKKLRINSTQLWNHVYQIKRQNASR